MSLESSPYLPISVSLQAPPAPTTCQNCHPAAPNIITVSLPCTPSPHSMTELSSCTHPAAPKHHYSPPACTPAPTTHHSLRRHQRPYTQEAPCGQQPTQQLSRMKQLQCSQGQPGARQLQGAPARSCLAALTTAKSWPGLPPISRTAPELKHGGVNGELQHGPSRASPELKHGGVDGDSTVALEHRDDAVKGHLQPCVYRVSRKWHEGSPACSHSRHMCACICSGLQGGAVAAAHLRDHLALPGGLALAAH
jgi:hypothetical protein